MVPNGSLALGAGPTAGRERCSGPQGRGWGVARDRDKGMWQLSGRVGNRAPCFSLQTELPDHVRSSPQSLQRAVLLAELFTLWPGLSPSKLTALLPPLPAPSA